MKPREVAALELGLYKLILKPSIGGYMLASVGQFHNGEKWFAASNWTTKKGNSEASLISMEWEVIEKAEVIRTRSGEDYLDEAKSLSFSQYIDPKLLEVLRDWLLTGHELDVIAVLARELGMSQRNLDEETKAVVDKAIAVVRSGNRWQLMAELRRAVSDLMGKEST